MRGVNEAASGMELDALEVLDVLDAFGEDGVRWYLMGILEGIEGRVEQEIEEYEMLEASIAYVVHESSVSTLEESEDTLRVWVEGAPKDLGAGIDLHIVDDEDEILNGGESSPSSSRTPPTIMRRRTERQSRVTQKPSEKP